MKQAGSRGLLERDAASDLWRNTLAHITSVFGRLTYLAALRNGNTGAYEHHGLVLVFGEKKADRALRRSHRKLFDEWLVFSVEEQKADLEEYLSSLPEPRQTIIENWLRLSPGQTVFPAHSRAVERELFSADFALVLAVLRAENGVDAQDPGA